MSRFDYPDPGQDPAYCNPLSEQPAPARCETCGSDVEGTIYSPGGAYEFCCNACWRQWGADLEEEREHGQD